MTVPNSLPFTGLNYNPTSSPGIASIDAAAGQSQQMNTFYWLKKSLIESRKEQYFLPLASTIGMPKHYGKTIKMYEYVPLLDDRNVNDQGLDANGATLVSTNKRINLPATVKFATADYADAAAAEAAATACAAAVNLVDGGTTAAKSGAASPWTVTFTKTPLEGTIAHVDAALVAVNNAANLAGTAGATGVSLSGNLYGSSKDIGTITGKLPVLGENGGRKNRVGFTRLELEGSLNKFGFFYEFSKESMDFDSDSELNEHLSRELMNGAVQLTEAVLQKDLLAAVGTTVWAGTSTTKATVTGEDDDSVVSYGDLIRLDQILTENRTPKQTKVITGSRLVDTKTIPAGRVMFVGSEIVPHLKAMKDLHNNPAFIPVQHYADASNVLNGEIGTIDCFRIIQVPEMLHWAGEGAAVDDNGTLATYRTTGNRYDVFPMLVIGDDSFTTIGFQTDGKSAKFSVITKMPGSENADREDPYGETGFSSIKWFYGILVKRPERLGAIMTVAPI